MWSEIEEGTKLSPRPSKCLNQSYQCCQSKNALSHIEFDLNGNPNSHIIDPSGSLQRNPKRLRSSYQSNRLTAVGDNRHRSQLASLNIPLTIIGWRPLPSFVRTSSLSRLGSRPGPILLGLPVGLPLCQERPVGVLASLLFIETTQESIAH